MRCLEERDTRATLEDGPMPGTLRWRAYDQGRGIFVSVEFWDSLAGYHGSICCGLWLVSPRTANFEGEPLILQLGLN